MPLCDLYLFALNSGIPSFLKTLRGEHIKPIIQARVVRWAILPSRLSTVPLLAHNNHWDLFLVVPHGTTLPSLAKAQITAQWNITAGVPSSRLQDWETKNNKLLNPVPGSIPAVDKTEPLKASSTQDLELSPELDGWISALPSKQQNHAISMFNLLAFNPDKKEQYGKYGAAFAETIGKRHGGDAKIVGNAIKGQGKDEGWDEVAVAHYPSLKHFRAMIGSKDYQEVNHKYRIGALKDTCILCTMEIDNDGELAGGKGGSKL